MIFVLVIHSGLIFMIGVQLFINRNIALKRLHDLSQEHQRTIVTLNKLAAELIRRSVVRVEDKK